ncbi:MAG: DNA repair protein RecN [Gemmatimonadaceae bacterium]
MLTELRVRNFAIIDVLTLPLAKGFNVLSGETGAGKSIIVGALSLLLGERATADVIRAGAAKAIIEGVFDAAGHTEILALLDDRGIDTEDGVVVLKREVALGGRARAWVNGSPVTAGALAEIGRRLVNLHGQHEAQALLDADSQRDILDAFAGAADAAAAVRDAFQTMAAARREIADLTRRRRDAEQRSDYLRHVTREIDDARLSDGEDVRLEDEARRLEHAEELRSLTRGLAQLLDGDDESVGSRLASAQRPLAAAQRIDPSLRRLQEVYDGALIAIEELGRELDEYAERVDLDPERLGEIRQRRELVNRLIKKYGGSIAAVLETARTAREELELVESGGLDLRQLESRERAALARWTEAADALSRRRKDAAGRLANAVDGVLPVLGMPDGHFEARLTPLTDQGANGLESVEFRVALNAGHDARPLARVASGGELSRVMLALKTILARLDRVPTLVFDEVDAGIGGRVGLQVGDAMRGMAGHHQVFAITHLAQIAARAHHHIVVAKDARGGVTTADVAVVEGTGRVAELARMLGGDPESDVSRAHARELLATVGSGGALSPDARLATTPTRRPRRS